LPTFLSSALQFWLKSRNRNAVEIIRHFTFVLLSAVWTV
jgi:hypothetical protein